MHFELAGSDARGSPARLVLQFVDVFRFDCLVIEASPESPTESHRFYGSATSATGFLPWTLYLAVEDRAPRPDVGGWSINGPASEDRCGSGGIELGPMGGDIGIGPATV